MLNIFCFPALLSFRMLKKLEKTLTVFTVGIEPLLARSVFLALPTKHNV